MAKAPTTQRLCESTHTKPRETNIHKQAKGIHCWDFSFRLGREEEATAPGRRRNKGDFRAFHQRLVNVSPGDIYSQCLNL